jgi:predicted metal-binding protein
VERDTLAQLARQIGFSHIGPLNMAALTQSEEVRAMCAADRCQVYGKSWGCPPACGTLDEMGRCLRGYQTGLLVQTTGAMADPFDLTAIRETEQRHKASFDALARQAQALFPRCLPMSAGACTRCHTCTYPDRPCRFPARLYPSMEAYGLWVSDVCRRSGLDYNYGTNTITYTACILADKLPMEGETI